TKMGGGTVVGGVIGGIAGGGKGAAVGAGVGAAAGTGVAAATGKKAAEVESEAVLTWVAQSAPAGTVIQGQDRRESRGSSRYIEEQDRQASKRHSNDEEGDYAERVPAGFSARERQIISECFVNDSAGLPPGLA